MSTPSRSRIRISTPSRCKFSGRSTLAHRESLNCLRDISVNSRKGERERRKEESSLRKEDGGKALAGWLAGWLAGSFLIFRKKEKRRKLATTFNIWVETWKKVSTASQQQLAINYYFFETLSSCSPQTFAREVSHLMPSDFLKIGYLYNQCTYVRIYPDPIYVPTYVL